MKRTRVIASASALLLAATLTACGATTEPTTSAAAATSTATVQVAGSSATTSTTAAAADALADDVESHAEADDGDYPASEAVTVTLADGASMASASDGVNIDGDTVTISAPGTYVLQGTLTDGQVVVDSAAEGKVRVVLADASVTSTTGSAFVVSAADEAVIVLQDGTDNSITDGASYGDDSDTDAPNAALYSMADLTITGTGSLAVTGNSNDGIASKDGLVIASGTVTVTAKDDGIRGKDYAILQGGTVSVTAGGDGIKSDNETDDTVGYTLVSGAKVTIAAGDDGIHAEGDLAVTDGSVTVSTSNEGLEGATITVAGGSTTVTASDDGVNVTLGTTTTTDGAAQGGGPGGGGNADQSADGAILTISGGTNVITADGDGLDSNGSTVITGGTTVVNGPTMNGNGALDSNGGITVSGGTLVAGGSSGMAEAPGTESSQGWLQVSFDSPVAGGETLSIVSGDTVVASFTTARETASLVVAAKGITSGDSYDVYVGASPADDATAGYSAGGSTDGGTKVTTVTAGQAAAGGGMRGPR